MDSAMNEEVNYCSQCGAKISSDAKFCSNCGCDLQNSSTKTPLDENVKVEAGTVNVEHDPSSSGMKTVNFFIFIIGAAFLIAFIALGMQEESLTESDRKDKELQDLRLKNETAQSGSIVQSGWEVFWSADPASRVKIVRSVRVRSDNGLCGMSVHRKLDDTRRTEFQCEFEIRSEYKRELTIKFDTGNNLNTMRLLAENNNTIYVEPYQAHESMENFLAGDVAPEYRYGSFINGLVSANFVAINITPTNSSVWIRFPLIGAKEAIAKLGKEL
jgi:hypothetical protein